MENNPQSDVLRELTGKSWNLELIISGAAVFLTTALPGLVDNVFNYYLDNLAPDDSPAMIMFPLLAYSFFQVIAWLLTVAFVVHLILRAFWVGLVGLRAAYPQGIVYDRLHGYTPVMKKFMAQHFGQIEPYIIRLDRLSNQIFAFAFLIALTSAAISIFYLLFFIVLLVLKNLLSDETLKILRQAGFILIYIVSGAALALRLYLYRRKDQQDTLGWRMVQVSRFFSVVFMGFLYRPVTYLMMTFTSNTPRMRYYVVLIITMLVISASAVGVVLAKVSDLRDRHIMDGRSFFADGAARTEILPKRYDNLRAPGERIASVSLPSDVIEGAFLPVFINYPKSLDARLERFCTPPESTEEKPGYRERRRLDSLRLDCISRFFQLSLNDTLRPQADWMFQEKNNTRGIVAYLPTRQCVFGKNVLIVRAPSLDKPDSLAVYGEAPFWFSPK